jgi:hypothetical protein
MGLSEMKLINSNAEGKFLQHQKNEPVSQSSRNVNTFLDRRLKNRVGLLIFWVKTLVIYGGPSRRRRDSNCIP